MAVGLLCRQLSLHPTELTQRTGCVPCLYHADNFVIFIHLYCVSKMAIGSRISRQSGTAIANVGARESSKE